MKEKLTKNDSMTTAVLNFDVLVAQFEAFLKKVNAHGFYFKEWAEEYDYNGTANVFYAWREWAKNFHPSLWINSAFSWRESNQGSDYWLTRHYMWKRNLKENLNK